MNGNEENRSNTWILYKRTHKILYFHYDNNNKMIIMWPQMQSKHRGEL